MSQVHGHPLLAADPPRVGDFWLDARLVEAPSGVSYLGHDDAGSVVMVVLLSQGAADDPAARDRLAGEVNRMHIDTVVARGGEGQATGRLGHRFRSEADDPVGPDEQPLAPWVALAYDGSPSAVAEAERLLAEVALSNTPLTGDPRGPGYALPWLERDGLGVNRLWPLPWPGRHDRAGWVSLLVSWLLMVLAACLAILIAILLFQNEPPQQPPPPLPTTASPTPSESPSPSPTPTPSESQSPSPSPSPSSASPSPASPSPSAGASPTRNSRL